MVAIRSHFPLTFPNSYFNQKDILKEGEFWACHV